MSPIHVHIRIICKVSKTRAEQFYQQFYDSLTQFSYRTGITVKAATLIFISGRGSAILSANKGYQVLFIMW